MKLKKYRQNGHSPRTSARALRLEASKDEWAVIRTGRPTRARGRVSVGVTHGGDGVRTSLLATYDERVRTSTCIACMYTMSNEI